MLRNREGDYITYKSGEFHAHGIIEKILEQDGETVYLVAEGNGGQRMTYVKPNDVLTLLTEVEDGKEVL